MHEPLLQAHGLDQVGVGLLRLRGCCPDRLQVVTEVEQIVEQCLGPDRVLLRDFTFQLRDPSG